MFEKTLIGGFRCVNTRLTFDIQILLSGKQNEKVVFDLLIDGKKQTKKKNIFSYVENGREQPIRTSHDKTFMIWMYKKKRKLFNLNGI